MSLSTAYQIVFDKAESISMNRRRTVAIGQSRNGVVRTVSQGGQVWRFEVRLPDGPRWSEYRPLIEQMEYLDRTTVSAVQINDPGLDWLTGYRGDAASSVGATAVFTAGNTIQLDTGLTTTASGQFRLRAGDFLQLGSSGSVYTVVSDVPHGSNSVTLNRAVIEDAGTYTLYIGQDVTWNVICTEFPDWTIFARDQISWSGPFVFYEDRVS